jgi:hypothetical protein
MVTSKNVPATKKMAPAVTPAKSDPNAFKVVLSESTRSQALAKLATSSVLSATTLKSYSGAGDALEVTDLMLEMKKAGDEAVAGDLSRVERMLTNQAMTLDAIFNNMAQRAYRQDNFKGIEVLMRLALKAQAQARSTAEALALLKNPQPYIKQANMTTGPQQVNNTYAGTPSHNDIQSGAGNIQSEQNKLLEADHGNYLDTRTQGTASRVNQTVEAVV